MRYVFSTRFPPFDRILLVESGSREILERLIPLLLANHPTLTEIDLVTCYPGEPQGLRSEGVVSRVYRVADYVGGRWKLLEELAARGYSNAGIICSGQPIMTQWKWAIALRVPVKIFLINENADFLFLDRGHWSNLVWLMKVRGGFGGAALAPSIARVMVFPFALVYLLLFAATVHLRRVIRSL